MRSLVSLSNYSATNCKLLTSALIQNPNENVVVVDAVVAVVADVFSFYR